MEKFCVKGIICYHGNLVFDAIFTQILTFLSIFLHQLTNNLKQVQIPSLKVN